MDQISIDLEKAPEVAELLAGKNAGDTVSISVSVTIAEKDAKRFVADINEVEDIDGETLASEDDEDDEDDEPTTFGKKKKTTFGDEADA